MRHIATIERYLDAEVAAGQPSLYAGCDSHLDGEPTEVQDCYQRLRAESKAIFRGLTDHDLQQKRRTPGNGKITL